MSMSTIGVICLQGGVTWLAVAAGLPFERAVYVGAAALLAVAGAILLVESRPRQ